MPDLPPWADPELSAALPDLVLAGESQTVEFKREFPRQISDLAKEIAGFATSNAGTILVGVDDDCSIVGIQETGQAARASLVQRIEGLCSGVVKPPITPRVRFADVDGKCVLAIDVPKGAQPIYWSGNIPYLRQVTAARPMTPDEVIEAVQNWTRSDEPSPEAHFFGALAGLLVDADIAIAEARVRDLEPWTSELKFQLDNIADQARDLAAQAPHALEPTIEPLEKLAKACETIAADDGLLGRPDVDTLAALDDGEHLVKLLRARWLGPGSFDRRTADRQSENVRTTARRLASFLARLDPEEIQETALKECARDRGLELLRAASLGIGVGNEKQRHTLWLIGTALRELETRDAVFDEGESIRDLIAALAEANERLALWIEGLAPSNSQQSDR